MSLLKVKISPVGIDGDNPTRFDLSVDTVNGSVFGNTKTLSQAQSWAEGVTRAIREQHEISFRLGLEAAKK